MKRFGFILWLALGVAIGTPAGWFAARRQFAKWATSFAAAETLPNLGEAYQALRALRKGDTNEAIESLESRLDSEIIALNALAGEERDEKRRAGEIRALTRVRDYRAAHPRKTESPEIDQGVADAFSSISTDKSK